MHEQHVIRQQVNQIKIFLRGSPTPEALEKKINRHQNSNDVLYEILKWASLKRNLHGIKSILKTNGYQFFSYEDFFIFKQFLIAECVELNKNPEGSFFADEPDVGQEIFRLFLSLDVEKIEEIKTFFNQYLSEHTGNPEIKERLEQKFKDSYDFASSTNLCLS